MAGESHAGESFEPCLRVSEQHFGLRMVRIFGIELQQAVGQQENDDALPGRAQRYWIDHARGVGAEFGGDFRDRMKHPVSVLELLETTGDDRPELAARTLIDAAAALLRQRDE